MKIAPITNNQYQNINFTQKPKNKEKKPMSPEKALKLCAAGALTSLAIAYGGGQLLIQDYKNNVNRILDNYEKEIIMLRNQTDSLLNDSIDENEQILDIRY